MKVYVFRYIGEYGDGLVFVGKKCEELHEFYSPRWDYTLLGVFDLPEDFLNAIGILSDEDKADFTYME